MQPKVAALDVASDPFAAKPSTGTVPLAKAIQGGMPPAPQSSSARDMDQAFSAVRSAEYGVDDGDIAGVPKGRPPWLLPVIVGVVALVVGGGIALVIALARS
jgi:hypothetical protein